MKCNSNRHKEVLVPRGSGQLYSQDAIISTMAETAWCTGAPECITDMQMATPIYMYVLYNGNFHFKNLNAQDFTRRHISTGECIQMVIN